MLRFQIVDWLGYCIREITFRPPQCMRSQSTNVTDGQATYDSKFSSWDLVWNRTRLCHVISYLSHFVIMTSREIRIVITIIINNILMTARSRPECKLGIVAPEEKSLKTLPENLERRCLCEMCSLAGRLFQRLAAETAEKARLSTAARL